LEMILPCPLALLGIHQLHLGLLRPPIHQRPPKGGVGSRTGLPLAWWKLG
jgi:hypothetical protein